LWRRKISESNLHFLLLPWHASQTCHLKSLRISSSVFTSEQHTPPSIEGFMIDRTNPLIEIRAQCITDYAKSKITTSSLTDGVPAVHACPRNDTRFHGSLHRMFYRQRCRRSSLVALSLTSKWLQLLAKPLLWGMLELGHEQKWQNLPAKDLLGRGNDRLLLSLMKSPELGLLVKAFAFPYTELMPIRWHDLRTETPREDEAPTTILWNDHPGIESPNLSDILPADCPELDKKLVYWTKTSNLLSYLPNLRSLKFSLDSGGPRGAYDFSDSFISRLWYGRAAV
jgi:hypothetical protein